MSPYTKNYCFSPVFWDHLSVSLSLKLQRWVYVIDVCVCERVALSYLLFSLRLMISQHTWPPSAQQYSKPDCQLGLYIFLYITEMLQVLLGIFPFLLCLFWSFCLWSFCFCLCMHLCLLSVALLSAQALAPGSQPYLATALSSPATFPDNRRIYSMSANANGINWCFRRTWKYLGAKMSSYYFSKVHVAFWPFSQPYLLPWNGGAVEVTPVSPGLAPLNHSMTEKNFYRWEQNLLYSEISD